MRTMKERALMIKAGADYTVIRAGIAVAGGMLAVCPAYCDINGNTAMQKFLKTMFSITVFAGIVLIAAGAASLIRTIVAMASGEQAQPGALGKGNWAYRGRRSALCPKGDCYIHHWAGPYDNDILLMDRTYVEGSGNFPAPFGRRE